MKIQQKRIELVGMFEAAEMFGVSKQVISNWRNRHSDFPEPLATLAMGSIFSKSDLKRWGRSSGKLKG